MDLALSASRIEPLETTIATAIGDEAVLLEMNSATYYELNATAARVWALARRGLTVGEIASDLREGFACGAQDVEGDLAVLVRDLRELGLVRMLDS